MRTLIVGAGMVGTIYGWALAEAGAEVVHVVRPGRLPVGRVELDVLDERPGFPRQRRARYRPEAVDRVPAGSDFDLVIVATKHYQAAEAVAQYREAVHEATFLLFTANWDGPAEIDRLLPRRQYVWGYSASMGGRLDGRLLITVRHRVRLGRLEGSDLERFAAVVHLMEHAGFRADIKPDIVEWLWVHHAINAGTIGIALFAGGVGAVLKRPGLMHRGVSCAREALAVVAARGVDVEHYPEARTILHTPGWVAAAGYAGQLLLTSSGRRVIRAGHFQGNDEEMRRFYLDVLETGERLRVPVPHLAALRARIMEGRGTPTPRPAGPGGG
ncbi:MAG TPA: 2-dehydropantoate 2-reductase N-terminal domain-containing protein [Candidatus Binatia bacterium]|nr:2-dehydropantoate 2-reductase N-terminal domain-containing protein [Candidatus Binatia bacterium]